jgi:hypothetical protein
VRSVTAVAGHDAEGAFDVGDGRGGVGVEFVSTPWAHSHAIAAVDEAVGSARDPTRAQGGEEPGAGAMPDTEAPTDRGHDGERCEGEAKHGAWRKAGGENGQTNQTERGGGAGGREVPRPRVVR